MKKTLLSLMLAAGFYGQAQTTHMVNWFFGVPQSTTFLTIDAGDTVMWMWTDTMPHTVTSNAGATETFNSGTISGSGSEFSHTFTTAGVSAYRCIFHNGMQGQITVNALATDAFAAKKFAFFPNPVNDVLHIQSAQSVGRVTIVDISGKTVLDLSANTPEASVHMGNFPSGIYFVTAQTDSGNQTFKVAKN